MATTTNSTNLVDVAEYFRMLGIPGVTSKVLDLAISFAERDKGIKAPSFSGIFNTTGDSRFIESRTKSGEKVNVAVPFDKNVVLLGNKPVGIDKLLPLLHRLPVNVTIDQRQIHGIQLDDGRSIVALLQGIKPEKELSQLTDVRNQETNKVENPEDFRKARKSHPVSCAFSEYPNVQLEKNNIGEFFLRAGSSLIAANDVEQGWSIKRHLRQSQETPSVLPEL